MFTQNFHGRKIACFSESREGISPPRAPRTVRETLASYGLYGAFSVKRIFSAGHLFPKNEWLGLIHRQAPIDRPRFRRRLPVDKFALLLRHNFIATITNTHEPRGARHPARNNAQQSCIRLDPALDPDHEAADALRQRSSGAADPFSRRHA